MPEKECLLLTFRPESDGVGESVHCLGVATDEGAAEVDSGKIVQGGLEVGDLADVIAETIDCQCDCIRKEK